MQTPSNNNNNDKIDWVDLNVDVDDDRESDDDRDGYDDRDSDKVAIAMIHNSSTSNISINKNTIIPNKTITNIPTIPNKLYTQQHSNKTKTDLPICYEKGDYQLRACSDDDLRTESSDNCPIVQRDTVLVMETLETVAKHSNFELSKPFVTDLQTKRYGKISVTIDTGLSINAMRGSITN